MFTVLFACSSEEAVEVSRISVGKIKDVHVIPISFNEASKIQIKTESFFVVLFCLPAINIGAEAFKVVYSDGTEYFTWEGHNKLYPI